GFPTDTTHLEFGSWRPILLASTLLLGVAAVAEVLLAVLDPAGPVPWLHRNVLLLVALVAMAAVYGVGLVRVLPAPSDWAVWGRRFGPVLGVLALAVLAVVLLQEILLYDRELKRTPM